MIPQQSKVRDLPGLSLALSLHAPTQAMASRCGVLKVLEPNGWFFGYLRLLMIIKDESSCQELREKIVPSAKHVSMEDLLAAMVSRCLSM